eukprot:COSAG01_NODE_16038_length_1275_cov_15.120748_2_plen_140_part_01
MESHTAVAAGTADAQHRQHAGQSKGDKKGGRATIASHGLHVGNGGKELGRRLKAAVAGDYEGHLVESLAAVAAGTADAQHRQHAENSAGGKEAGRCCKGIAKTDKTAKGGNDEREGEEEIGGPDAKLFVGGLAWEIDNEA